MNRQPRNRTYSIFIFLTVIITSNLAAFEQAQRLLEGAGNILVQMQPGALPNAPELTSAAGPLLLLASGAAALGGGSIWLGSKLGSKRRAPAQIHAAVAPLLPTGLTPAMLAQQAQADARQRAVVARWQLTWEKIKQQKRQQEDTERERLEKAAALRTALADWRRAALIRSQKENTEKKQLASKAEQAQRIHLQHVGQRAVARWRPWAAQQAERTRTQERQADELRHRQEQKRQQTILATWHDQAEQTARARRIAQEEAAARRKLAEKAQRRAEHEQREAPYRDYLLKLAQYNRAMREAREAREGKRAGLPRWPNPPLFSVPGKHTPKLNANGMRALNAAYELYGSTSGSTNLNPFANPSLAPLLTEDKELSAHMRILSDRSQFGGTPTAKRTAAFHAVCDHLRHKYKGR